MSKIEPNHKRLKGLSERNLITQFHDLRKLKNLGDPGKSERFF